MTNAQIADRCRAAALNLAPKALRQPRYARAVERLLDAEGEARLLAWHEDGAALAPRVRLG